MYTYEALIQTKKLITIGNLDPKRCTCIHTNEALIQTKKLITTSNFDPKR